MSTFCDKCGAPMLDNTRNICATCALGENLSKFLPKKGGGVQMPEGTYPPLISPETPSSESGRGEHSGDCSIYSAGSVTCDCGYLRKVISAGKAADADYEAWAKHCAIIEQQSPMEKSFKSQLLTFLHEKAEEQRKCAERWKDDTSPKRCPFCGTMVEIWGEGRFIRHPSGQCWLSNENRITVLQWNNRPENLEQQIHSRASNAFQEVITYIESH